MISICMDGNISSLAFLLKILFTALTLGCGYKGGEIVPTFFIGAAFGSMFGNLIGFSPSLCAAIGMGAMFCGVTNSPITSLLICFELFGFEGTPFFYWRLDLATPFPATIVSTVVRRLYTPNTNQISSTKTPSDARDVPFALMNPSYSAQSFYFVFSYSA